MPMRMPMYSTVLIMLRYADEDADVFYNINITSRPSANTLPQQLTSKSTAKRLDHSSPAGHRETQPFVPVIQRSADDPSNSRETTSLPTLNQIPTPSTHFPICSLLTCNPSDNPEFYRRNQMLSAPSSPVIPPAIATLSLPP